MLNASFTHANCILLTCESQEVSITGYYSAAKVKEIHQFIPIMFSPWISIIIASTGRTHPVTHLTVSESPIHILQTSYWHSKPLQETKDSADSPVMKWVSLPVNDSMRMKTPVVSILPLCRWHWICLWQAGMVVCHIYTAWLRIWSGKLKESLKQEKSYLFRSQGQEYAFFFLREETWINKKTDFLVLQDFLKVWCRKY